MAFISPPAWQQAGTYAARTDRLSVLSALLGYPGFASDEATPLRVRTGVKPSYQTYQLKVSAQGTPNMTVSLAAGFGFIENKDIAGYGAYTVVNDAPITLTIAASSGSQFRKDTIVVQVLDAETLGVVNSATAVVVQGPYAATAGATVRGTIPPNSLILADVAVDAGVTSIIAGKITDVRTYQIASGGVLPVLSTAVPDHPAPGQPFYLTDTSVLRYGTTAGTTKQIMTEEQITPGAWQAYTPTWSAAGTAPAIGNGSITARWCRVGRLITYIGSMVIGSSSTGGTGIWAMSLPVAAAANGVLTEGTANYTNVGDNYYLGVSEIASGASTLTWTVKTNAAPSASAPVTTSVPVTASSNTRVHWNITYEAAS